MATRDTTESCLTPDREALRRLVIERVCRYLRQSAVQRTRTIEMERAERKFADDLESALDAAPEPAALPPEAEPPTLEALRSERDRVVCKIIEILSTMPRYRPGGYGSVVESDAGKLVYLDEACSAIEGCFRSPECACKVDETCRVCDPPEAREAEPPALDAAPEPETPPTCAEALRLARRALNTWGCFARRGKEQDAIAESRREIDEFEASLHQPHPPGGGDR